MYHPQRNEMNHPSSSNALNQASCLNVKNNFKDDGQCL